MTQFAYVVTLDGKQVYGPTLYRSFAELYRFDQQRPADYVVEQVWITLEESWGLPRFV